MKKILAVVAVLALAGCSAIGLGPDPALVQAAPTIKGALAGDAAAHPENAAADAAAGAAVDAAVGQKSGVPPVVHDVAGLLPPPWGNLLELASGLGVIALGYLHRKNAKKVAANAAVINQHADLIDSATTDNAPDAAKVGAAAPPAA